MKMIPRKDQNEGGALSKMTDSFFLFQKEEIGELLTWKS